MKTKKLILLAAMLLMNVCTFAQSGTPLKGDVNNDGKVDVADIAAIIAIMKNGGGTGEKVYYWYVGQEKPTSSSVPTDNLATDHYPGWRLIEDPDTYVWDATNSDGTIKEDTPVKNIWYFAVPNGVINVKDWSDAIIDDEPINTITINNVQYTVWETPPMYVWSGYKIAK